MKVAMRLKNIRIGIAKGLATQHPLKFLGVLAMGAVLLAGTALHFAPSYTQEADNPTALSAAEEPKDFPADARRVESPYYHGFGADDRSRALPRDLAERLRVDVQQEAGSWDANEPAASLSAKPTAADLPGSDDFYWPPVLEEYARVMARDGVAGPARSP